MNLFKTSSLLVSFLHSFLLTLKDAEFSWTPQQKGLLLSLSFFGYMVAPIGGFIGSHIGYCTVFGFCVGANAFISFLSPTLLRCSIYVYGATRILEGIFEVGIKQHNEKEILSRFHKLVCDPVIRCGFKE